MPQPVTVRVRDCACPHTPHADEGDLVTLRPTLSLEGGIAAQQDIQAVRDPDTGAFDQDALTRRWVVTFVRFGAKGWNLLDEDGKPVPFDVQDLLDDFLLSQAVADAASDLYLEAVLRPLGVTAPAS